ncbi:uncharacterized protein LOC130631600 isoform X2 [Hydractinia symbiolongicarpus]|uniref:uncharacterized protein LOC130631600 isoform X2 n=1 Tax=Hydractinia symbiolongicarpus TaxID=13093 RepID=UPI00254E3469|nr:uncharacterized protein LOC130631600 isoform X2 [Hydractinia symbiolongicarpus]
MLIARALIVFFCFTVVTSYTPNRRNLRSSSFLNDYAPSNDQKERKELFPQRDLFRSHMADNQRFNNQMKRERLPYSFDFVRPRYRAVENDFEQRRRDYFKRNFQLRRSDFLKREIDYQRCFDSCKDTPNPTGCCQTICKTVSCSL